MPIEIQFHFQKNGLTSSVFRQIYFLFLTIPMSTMTEFIQKRLVFKSTNLSVDKLSDALELTDKSDSSKNEQKILQSIVSFGSVETKQIMRPRVDVFSVSIELSFIQLLDQIRKRFFKNPCLPKTN